MFNKDTEYIIAAYDYFERRLRQLCSHHAGISGPLKADEARRLIVTHTDVKLPGDRLWQDLMMLKKIVNVLRENAGRLEEYSLLHYCRKSGIAAEDGGHPKIAVSADFGAETRRKIMDFFEGMRI